MADSDREGEKERKRSTVKLISAEGFEFVIDRQAAMVSKTLKGMLESSGMLILMRHVIHAYALSWTLRATNLQ